MSAEPARMPAYGLPRLLAGLRRDGHPVSLQDHLDRHGAPLPRGRGGRVAAHEIIERVAASGLTGRGGAGFPTARKLEAVAAGRRKAIVVANGTEGEPISQKDKTMLALQPHLVLDGAVLAATAVGADEAVIAVGRAAGRAQESLAAALRERRAARLDRVRLSTAVLPDRFVSGEETALVQWLNGGPAKPTVTPPRPFDRGVRGAPTLVQNVETLAQLALIDRYGPDWFRELGTREEPGSVLVSLGGAVGTPAVYEIELGMRLSDLLDQAGGTTHASAAVLIGGYFGAWVDMETARRLPLLDSELAPFGASLGARAIVVLPRSACGLVETVRVARYLARESAAQCGPCEFGLSAVAEALVELTRGKTHGNARHLPRWLQQIRGRSACKHPDGSAHFVESALRVFESEISLHVHERRCSGRRGHTVLPVPGDALVWR